MIRQCRLLLCEWIVGRVAFWLPEPERGVFLAHLMNYFEETKEGRE